jgi:hypothetical protein
LVEILETALFYWAAADLRNLQFQRSIFHWNRLAFRAMRSDLSQIEKNKADEEAEAWYKRATELQNLIAEDYKRLADFIIREKVFSFLSLENSERIVEEIN